MAKQNTTHKICHFYNGGVDTGNPVIFVSRLGLTNCKKCYHDNLEGIMLKGTKVTGFRKSR